MDDDDEIIVYMTKSEARALIDQDNRSQLWQQAAAPNSTPSKEVALIRSAAQKIREALE